MKMKTGYDHFAHLLHSNESESKRMDTTSVNADGPNHSGRTLPEHDQSILNTMKAINQRPAAQLSDIGPD